MVGMGASERCPNICCCSGDIEILLGPACAEPIREVDAQKKTFGEA